MKAEGVRAADGHGLFVDDAAVLDKNVEQLGAIISEKEAILSFDYNLNLNVNSGKKFVGNR